MLWLGLLWTGTFLGQKRKSSNPSASEYASNDNTVQGTAAGIKLNLSCPHQLWASSPKCSDADNRTVVKNLLLTRLKFKKEIKINKKASAQDMKWRGVKMENPWVLCSAFLHVHWQGCNEEHPSGHIMGSLEVLGRDLQPWGTSWFGWAASEALLPLDSSIFIQEISPDAWRDVPLYRKFHQLLQQQHLPFWVLSCK